MHGTCNKVGYGSSISVFSYIPTEAIELYSLEVQCFHMTKFFYNFELVRPHLHGSGPIFTGTNLFLDRLFTWIRANYIAVVFTWVQSRQPGKK